MTRYCSYEQVHRKRLKYLYSKTDPLLTDIAKLITSNRFRPAIRQQVDNQLKDLHGYVKLQLGVGA